VNKKRRKERKVITSCGIIVKMNGAKEKTVGGATEL